MTTRSIFGRRAFLQTLAAVAVAPLVPPIPPPVPAPVVAFGAGLRLLVERPERALWGLNALEHDGTSRVDYFGIPR